MDKVINDDSEDEKSQKDSLDLNKLFKDTKNLSDLTSEFSILPHETLTNDWNYITNVISSFGVIYSSLHLNNVLEFVIDSLITVIQAERGFLLLKNNDGRLEFKIARDADKNNLPKNSFKIVKSILVNSYKSKAIYFYEDITKEKLFQNSKMVQRSIICCPILLNYEILGLIYADSSKPLIHDSEIKKELVQLFSNQAAIAIRNAIFYQSQEQSFQQLSNTADNLVDVEKLAVESRLSAHIGHTLNTLLQDTASNLELATKYLRDNNINKVVERLKNISIILNQLKGLSQELIENINIETKLRVYDVNRFVNQFISFAETVYSRLDITFDTNLKNNIPKVKIDKTQMHLVLYNIINFIIQKSNVKNFIFATEYNIDQQRVKLSLFNHSPGLIKEEFLKLFEPISYLPTDIENRFGLLICKEIILKHSGSLSVENYKNGLKFVISIPNIE
ncbi:GAF domain-containing sensor histidine kinase [candidate division KSB1 bacterium]|nr:GAF domain-containing sensor histidine kinase [candidate division KSB1 bacterium]